MGENRAQALEEKAAAWNGRAGFRWHFIGQLQSRKVKVILPLVELVHSVASDSVLEQLGRHGTPDTRVLVQVNVAREEGKAGVDPGELGAFIARCPVQVAGLMTMPPSPQRRRRRAGRTSAALAELAARARPARAVHGHVAGLPRRGGGGRDDRAGRLAPVSTAADG